MRRSVRSYDASLILLLFVFVSPSYCQQIPTTVQLPTFGVAVDADGVLNVKTFAAPDPRLLRERLVAAEATLPGDVFASSKLRKISLTRLERDIRRRLAEGKSPDNTMRHLAGLVRLQYVFFFPDLGEVIIAGPAEGWIDDASGRTVGVTSGRPTMLLEDLLVSLRAYPPGRRKNPFVGCTISPTPEGLASLRDFQRTIPNAISQSRRAQVSKRVVQGVRDSLGMANIHVYGISDRTHFAQVMIEADYRMKRIAIGLEKPPVPMTTYIAAVFVPKHMTLQRWWFTPNYECVKVTEDRLAMELIGQGVQLESQDKLIGRNGSLIDAVGSKPSRAARLYTTSFTDKYAEIAAAAPVYAQLRNQIDMLVAAAFIQRQDYYARADWPADLLLDESSLPTETLQNATKVDCAVNLLWKGNRMLCPAGGGVSIKANEALEQDRLLEDERGQLRMARETVSQGLATPNWWWD